MRLLAPIQRALSSIAPSTAAMRGVTCRERAQSLVHKYAVAGTTWAVLPLPIATSIGLTAMETHLVYWIGRVYGEHPSSMDVAMTAGGLELASIALKMAAIEAA